MLQVTGLSLSVPFRVPLPRPWEGSVPQRVLALRDLSLTLPAGGSLGLVGESGSGKTLTAMAIAGLNAPQVRYEAGSILFDGQEITTMPEAELRSLRGFEIAVVFQDSTGALNPLMQVGDQVAEGLILFDGLSKEQAGRQVQQLFQEVEMPRDAGSKYPHQLSGGQRQRVMIAIALARRPRLLIADEPTTALDITTQRQIIDLLQRLHQERQMALLLISHDISVVKHLCQSLVVLYAGGVVESGSAKAILQYPRHPYTQGLLGALPSFALRGHTLETLHGTAEPLHARPASGCHFVSRCSLAISACYGTIPLQQNHEGVSWRCLM
ncbi:MAG: ABC transporter ATP-binding protein [Symbiobacteriaceae bacterium]|nr:ABC transporter ATP-binding protein [Symbiobacteriaceae bacterium]